MEAVPAGLARAGGATIDQQRGHAPAVAGVLVVQLALAFATTHPGVSCALIGPRTEDKLDGLLAGAEASLSDEILDGSTRSCLPAPTSAYWTRPASRRP